MRFVEVFRIYNLKFLKKNKLNLCLTLISIFLCITVSLVTPVIKFYYEKNINDNIVSINGGDLCIFCGPNQSEEFKNKLNELEDEGLDIKTCYISSTSYTLDSKEIAGRVIYGSYGDVYNNEVILSRGLAESLNLSKGDTAKIKVNGDVKDFLVKDIETIAKGVDQDSEMLGFGRINIDEGIDTTKKHKAIYISGKDGEELKDEFQGIDSDAHFITANEKKSKMQEDITLEVTVLDILGSVTLSLSLLSIAVFVFMNILKRKKDIGTLKLISIKNGTIEKAMFLEMTLVFLMPLILAGIASVPLAKVFLDYKGIDINIISLNTFMIVFKGVNITLLTAWICIFISLNLCNKIKILDILKNDDEIIMKHIKKSLFKLLFILPALSVIYGLLNNDKSFILSALAITIFVCIFLIFVCILIKAAGAIRYRNKVLLYTFKSIKKNSIVFIFTVLSLTITVTFILMGYYLKDTIDNNINEAVSNALPYNYEVIPDNEDFDDEGITASGNVDGYDKTYGFDCEMINETRSSIYKRLVIEEINKEDYHAKFNISEGSNLFDEADGEVIMADDMFDRCGFSIGDTVMAKYGDEVLRFVIKGAYKSSGINDITLYKENKQISQDTKPEYLVLDKDGSFLKNVKDCMIWNLNDIGARFTSSLDRFLKVFKILAIITVISIIIVNINVTNMAESLNEKNNEIIIALGMGEGFVFKSRIVKVIANSLLASILSIGLFGLIISFGVNIMFKVPGSIKPSTAIILSFLALVFSTVSYIFNVQGKKTSFDLIREE